MKASTTINGVALEMTTVATGYDYYDGETLCKAGYFTPENASGPLPVVLVCHAFTRPAANMPEVGAVYNELTDRRFWQAMLTFFAEAL